MQAYAQIVDKTLTYDDLPGLGAKLKLPDGWRYSTTVPQQDIVAGAKGKAPWCRTISTTPNRSWIDPRAGVRLSLTSAALALMGWIAWLRLQFRLLHLPWRWSVSSSAASCKECCRKAIIVDRIWREGQLAPQQSTPFKASAEGEAFYQRVQELQPSNDIQRGLKERVIQVTTDLAQARFLLFSHLGSSIPVPFLAVLLLWMIVLFAGFSLMAPANATTLASLVICALSVSGAIFLILELDQPFSGIIVIQSDSLRNALPPLGP